MSDPKRLKARADISVLFTDVNMPGSVDGLKLACGARPLAAHKILVVSGEVRLQQSKLPSNSCFVGKPYRAAAMVEELRLLVGSPPL